MNQKCALVKSLLRGEVLSIMNGFHWFGITNIPREIGRSVERSFGVRVSRVSRDFISKYGQAGYYFEYRLNRTEQNKDGVLKMEAYVKEIEGKPYSPPVKRGPKLITPQRRLVQKELF